MEADSKVITSKESSQEISKESSKETGRKEDSNKVTSGKGNSRKETSNKENSKETSSKENKETGNKANSNKKSHSKKKFVSIDEIENALLPGRQKCDCEASVHELICNCLNCGRIVCEQEGVGPCFTCGQKVIPKREIEELARMNKETGEAKKKTQQNPQHNRSRPAPAAKSLKEIASSLIGIDAATEHKNKLLEYERNSEKRTKVIDDEMDYFDLTKENWLSNEKREELKEKVEQLHEDKFDIERRFELDINSRKVVEVAIPKVKDLNEEVSKLKEETAFKSDYEVVDFKEILANEPELEPYYMETAGGDKKEGATKPKSKSNKKQQNKKPAILPNITLVRNRLQSSDLFDSSDEGYALTINQPWASLAVHGIKLHEGRSWLTTHKGPLWIHASAKSPRREEIQEAESLFRLMLDDKSVQFPPSYPTGCVIGRVNLTECLSQEEYRARFGNAGYAEDPYVFIFSDPIKLKATVPWRGNPKIFKLEKGVFKMVSAQIAKTYGSTKKS